MDAKTCAACDYKLDGNAIKVKIGGKTVEVCCDECAEKLKEVECGSLGRKQGTGIAIDSEHGLPGLAVLAFPAMPLDAGPRIDLLQHGLDPRGTAQHRVLAADHTGDCMLAFRHQGGRQVATAYVFQEGPPDIGACQFGHAGR